MEKHLRQDPRPPADEPSAEGASIGQSAAMMGALVIVSRITGFIRTWGQAFALGLTLTSSCYTVASNLPNQLYELVMGGLLATSFLPVYLTVKEKSGREGANAYASNLLSIVLLFMGILSVAGIVFASQFIWTQSFTATSTFDADQATYFFRFFSIEMVFYGLSAVISGILNAERDYFWSNAAPILNNVVCTASFFIYAWLFPTNPGLAMLILAIGNPAGVAIQVVAQLPAMRRHGVHITWHINWHDHLLRETLAIGAPTLVVTVVSFVTCSVQSTAALSVTDQGASIAYYGRLWYTLPYAIISVPITTAMFTELSTMVSRHDHKAFVSGVTSGASQILFFLVPFAIYLMVFSYYLITLLAFGKFGEDEIGSTASYLAALAVSLPAYGLATYLQKVCSSLRKMGLFAISSVVAGVAQVVICLWLAPVFGLNIVAYSSTVFFVAVDLVTLLNLKRTLGHVGIMSMIRACLKSLVLGLLGGGIGFVVASIVNGLLVDAVPMVVTSIACLACGGIVSLVVTFGLAVALHIPEASYVHVLVRKLLHR